MEILTWIPGSNKEYDKMFDYYRTLQHNSSHRLSENYNKNFYKFSIAFTMAINNSGDPEICSSIASRDCWPKNIYRILNRLWKTHNYRIKHSKFISEAMAGNAISQINWLKENTDCELYFISRETSNWLNWTKERFNNQYDLKFNIGLAKYLTCPNKCDDTCWQYIIYNGNQEKLLEWEQR